MRRTWTLLGPDGKPFASARLLSAPSFFLTRTHARTAGYRPCAVCQRKRLAALGAEPVGRTPSDFGALGLRGERALGQDRPREGRSLRIS